MCRSQALHFQMLPLIKQVLIGRLEALITGKLVMHIHLWVTFPDGGVLGCFGEVCVAQGLVIHFMGGITRSWEP